MRPIAIVDYDPSWPSLFEARRRDIAEILGNLVLDILHIGSTAVPGLCAKPKIDIDAVLRSHEMLDEALERVRSSGYVFHGDPYRAGRWMFTRDAYDGYGVRLYVCGPDNRAHIDRVLFRDWLRAHPEDAAAYAALKQGLAAEAGGNWDFYTGGKSAFVAEILRRAAGSKTSSPV